MLNPILACLLCALLTLPMLATADDKKASKNCPFKSLNRVTKVLAKPMDLLRRKGAADVPLTPPAPFQARGKSNLINATTEARYIRGIAQRLLGVWPGDKPKSLPSYYVSSSSFYQAEAMFDRGIVFTLGLLDTAESDAEVAFVLAHELAHVLLGHMDDQESMRRSLAKLDVLKRGIDYVSQVSAMGVQTAGQSDAKLADQSKKVQSDIDKHNHKVADYVAEFQELLDKVASPVWTSAQEDAADLMAVELMLRAGYSPSGAARSLSHMEDAQNDACAELQGLLADLDGYREQAETFDWTTLLENPEQNASWTDSLRP